MRPTEAALHTAINLLHDSFGSKRMLMLIVALLMCSAVPAVAGPFEDALAAYQKGDYVTALRLWQPLADQGAIPTLSTISVFYTKKAGACRRIMCWRTCGSTSPPLKAISTPPLNATTSPRR